MAGDLFIESISYEQFSILREAHGIVEEVIYHANRSWNEYENVLRARLQAGQQSRAGLPAHGYVTFNSAARNQVAGFVTASLINKGRLGNVLDKVSRPLGLVTANPHLGNWYGPTVSGLRKVDILIAALQMGNVIIEYYKYDGSPILFARPGWARHDEQPHA